MDDCVVGLAISLSLNCTQSLNWSVRMSSDLESQMVSVERVKTYSNIEQEPPHYPSANGNGILMNRIDHWPNKGAIDFINSSWIAISVAGIDSIHQRE